MRLATALLALVVIAGCAPAAEDRFPTPEEQAKSFAPYDGARIDGVAIAHWLAARKALLLTGVRQVEQHGGGAASVRNDGFACAAPLTADGYLLTVRHSLAEPVMALRRAVGRPELKPARVVWSGDAEGCDLAVLKVDWSGCDCCRWADDAAMAPGTTILAAGCYLAEEDDRQFFRDDRAAGTLAAPARATGATGAAPAFALLDARLPVHPGDSGGPVLTVDGRLIGVTMAHLLDPRTGESTGASRIIRPDIAFIERVIADDRAGARQAGPAAVMATVIPGK